MAEPYLQNLRDLLDRLAPAIQARHAITCKHFFSGAAAYVEGNIFLTVTPVGLALKLPQARRNELLAKGAEPLRYFPGAPVKKDYALLPPALAENDAELALLIVESIAACLTGKAR